MVNYVLYYCEQKKKKIPIVKIISYVMTIGLRCTFMKILFSIILICFISISCKTYKKLEISTETSCQTVKYYNNEVTEHYVKGASLGNLPLEVMLDSVDVISDDSIFLGVIVHSNEERVSNAIFFYGQDLNDSIVKLETIGVTGHDGRFSFMYNPKRKEKVYLDKISYFLLEWNVTECLEKVSVK